MRGSLTFGAIAAAVMSVAGCSLSTLSRAIEAAAARTPPTGQIRDDAFHSDALGVRKHLFVYLPPSYATDTTRRYPVVYYLHGLSGAEGDWIAKAGINFIADSLFAKGVPETILVMPDGDDGWYTTWSRQYSFSTCADTLRVESPAKYCVEHERYDDYIARDVVRYIDGQYRTRADRDHRGIAGLSMGGYGAIILALQHSDVFAAAASHSGVLSPMYVGGKPVKAPIKYAANAEEIRPTAGGFWARYLNYWGTDLARWREVDAAHVAESMVRRGVRLPALFFDCGVDDGFIDQNRAFDLELTRLGVAHTYAEWAGAHTWRYWTTHARESLAWMGERVGR